MDAGQTYLMLEDQVNHGLLIIPQAPSIQSSCVSSSTCQPSSLACGRQMLLGGIFFGVQNKDATFSWIGGTIKAAQRT